ncbi:VWA domain-containing protein [Aeromonas sp. A-5]|uniref:VWA domain-containing protein n=1 Tax=Aeromonas ichthyocola TaxID=3367746 RepID=UPI0038E7A53F
MAPPCAASCNSSLRRLDIWLLDLSRSMTATDLKPDRATRVRWQLQQLLSRAKGERIALILFAGDAYLAMPPTRDHQALSLLLPDLRPDIMPLQGSNPARAVELAMKQLAPGEQARLLLITDDLTQNQMTQIAALWPCQQRLLCRHTQSARLDILLASGQPAPMSAIPANPPGVCQSGNALGQLPAPDSQAIAALASTGGRLQWLQAGLPSLCTAAHEPDPHPGAPLDSRPLVAAPSAATGATGSHRRALVAAALMVGWQLLALQDLQATERPEGRRVGKLLKRGASAGCPHLQGPSLARQRLVSGRSLSASYRSLSGSASATAHYNRGNALLQLSRSQRGLSCRSGARTRP